MILSPTEAKYDMPSEEYEHKSTWMGFPSESTIWKSDLKLVQKDIILLAKTIAKYEPVNLIVKDLK